eukprot:TRINITY_DN7529_c0_g1_i2.p1 TRINITY_DN7529_c0_g1~~TRINITY_DN7529_c0_g1_i2.p1  ORF type:complete len:127 (+),score=17.90 TRINITY_DN7529_c0_g1_i2:22-381(+)
METSTAAFLQAVGLQKRPPQGFLEEVNDQFTMGYKKRITLFALFLLVGLALCFLSTMVLFSPRSFAKFYTLGTVCILCSTFFLMGPAKQFRTMFHPRPPANIDNDLPNIDGAPLMPLTT